MTEVAPATRTLIRVFGGVDLAVPGRVLSVGGPRQRRLLALLTARSGEVVSIDWLAEYLWSDSDRPEATASALRTYVSRLRQSFPEDARAWLLTEQSGYRLEAPSAALEHHLFVALRTRALQARESGDPTAAQDLLNTALEMWRGEPFRELEDLQWAQAEVERLRLDRLEMMEERWETALALGRHTQITGELAAFTSDQPLRERSARQYALALYRSGRTAEALRVIDDHRRFLAEGSGLEPSQAMVELEAAILTSDGSLDLVDDITPLRGYRLVEQVGAGAFSVVWRAIQPSVDRPVAIKQIRSELASQPDFIRSFETEARLVARIEHPHIVPLIDFWRDPDAAYLVMRWLPGDTLERLVDDGPLPIDRTVEIAAQVGSALSAAHAQGVIHRDVKSANIMFDADGHAFLTDFGIALTASESSGPAAALSTGSPAYASPEQLQREPLTAASDVFSLAVVVFECLTGRTPFFDSPTADVLIDRQMHEPPPLVTDARPEVPEHIADALSRALSKAPADRFASTDEFIRALDRTTQDSAQTAARVVDDANPYLGLRSFDEADAGRFFGRRRLVTEMLKRLSSDDLALSRSLVVVGPSGSGKSSVVRAGLLPALTAGDVPGSAQWFTTMMVPGSGPFEALEAALLRIAVNPPASLIAQLRDGPRGILRGVRRCLPGDRDVLALVVDQFEELFIGRTATDADQFLEGLATAVTDPSSPLRLICTLRADYYHHPLEHASFAPILKHGAVDVTPLAADETEEAIIEPAHLAGVEFESGLVPRIAAETLGQPSPLPLLQHVLAELYERRSGHTLTIDAYDRLGGVSGALAARAESIYLQANDEQQAATRHLFGALTDPGQDRTDLRRRVIVNDLGETVAMQWVLDQFVRARLITLDRDTKTRRPTVEVAHEALLREWPRLVQWLKDDRDLLRTVERLSAAVTTWDESGRQVSDLFRGGRLEQAIDLETTAPDRLRTVDHQFIDASRARATAERATEQRRVRRLRQLNTGVTIALVIALIAGAVAIQQRNQAQQASADALAAETDAGRARDDAELVALLGQSDGFVDDNPDLAILLALEANRRSPSRETQRAVLHALGSVSARITSIDLPEPDPEQCPAFDHPLTVSADGTTGFSTLDGRLITIDLATGAVKDEGPAPARCVIWTGDQTADVRWVSQATPAGTQNWNGTWSGPLDEVDLDGSEVFVPGSLVGDRMFLSSGNLDQLIIDPRSTDLISSSRASTWGLTTVGPRLTYTETGWALDPTGTLVVVHGVPADESVESGSLLVLDGRNGELLRTISMENLPTAVDIRDGIAFVGDEVGRITTVDLSTGENLRSVTTNLSTGIVEVGARPDGLVVAASKDRVILVDPVLGSIGRAVRIEVGAAAATPDGGITVLNEQRTRASTIEMRSTALVESSVALDEGVTVGLDAGRAAIVRPDGTITTIKLDTNLGETVSVTQLPEGFDALGALPTDDGFVAFGERSIVSLWRNAEPVERVPLHDNSSFASFAPLEAAGLEVGPSPAHARNGALLSFGSSDYQSSAYLIDWTAAELDVRFMTSNLDLVSATGSPDGGIHVINQDGLVRSYDADGRWSGEIKTGVRAPYAVAHSGSDLFAVGGINGAVLAEPTTGEVRLLRGLDNVVSLAFARQGEMLVVVERDGDVHLWDVASNESFGRLWVGTVPAGPSQPWYDAEHDTVWVATGNQILELILDPDHWIKNACAFVGRDITDEEWDQYVPGDTPRQTLCDY